MNEELKDLIIRALESVQQGGYRDVDGDWRTTYSADMVLVVQALKGIRESATRPVAEAVKQTDVSKRLRMDASDGGYPHRSYAQVSKADLRAAADEIDRYYTGMLNWKRTAEAKDAKLVADRAAPSARVLSESQAANLDLVIARLEQISGNSTDDCRNSAEEALVCARAVAATSTASAPVAPTLDYTARQSLIEELREFAADPGYSHNDYSEVMLRAADGLDLLAATSAQGDAKDAPSAADYEEALASHRRLVRELDVLLNGESGAAKQASLCDIVSQVRAEGIKAGDGLVRDAARYRHIRDTTNNGYDLRGPAGIGKWHVSTKVREGEGAFLFGERLDIAIDAAITAASTAKGDGA